MRLHWRNMVRLAIAGLVLAGLAAGGLFLRLKARMGDFVALHPHFEGSCQGVVGLPGASDMAVDRQARRIWVSSLDRVTTGARGAIYLMPLDGIEAAPVRVDVTLGKPAVFAPLGLSLWTAQDGRQVLYVVNRPVGRAPSIEIYDVDKSGVLKHRSSVEAPRYPRLNDVAGAGPDAFYVSVESVHRAGSVLSKLGQMTTDESGSILFWTDGKFKRLASDMDFANSLALTPDGATLYATATMDQELRVYDRKAADNSLSLRERVYLGSSPDNIDIAPDGGIWIASHPKLGAFLKYAAAPKTQTAPSQVLLVERDPSGQGGDVHQIYLGAAGPLSGATIAINEGDRLLLGGAYAPDALTCVMPQNFRQDVAHRFIGVR
ncbi:MAG: SMP-30/gluconolactonase/LRE family protein [Caulobacterales bacterium]